MRGNEAVRLCDPLADQHRVPLLYNGLCGFSDVLLQGKYHFTLRIIQAQPDVPAQLFMLRRMDAAAKSVSHSLSDPFPVFAAPRLLLYSESECDPASYPVYFIIPLPQSKGI